MNPRTAFNAGRHAARPARAACPAASGCSAPAGTVARPVLVAAGTPASLLAALLLAGCGGGGDDGSAPAASPAAASAMVTVSGVAAVGTPVVGATVSLRCSGSGAVAGTTTDSAGAYTLSLAANRLPCGMEISGGTVGGAANVQLLHSLIDAAGTVNATPLTDLSVAIASALAPSAWFAAIDASHAPALGEALGAATARVLQSLTAAGYTLPAAGFDPRTSAFTAAAGNAYDGLLDAFGKSLAASGTTYPQLLTNVLANAAKLGGSITLPTFGVDSAPSTGPTGTAAGPIVLIPKANIQAADLAPLVGKYTGTQASNTPTGGSITRSASCEIAAAADGRLSITVGGRTVSAPANGDVGDMILGINSNTTIKAIAFDFASNQNVTIEVVRGVMVGAIGTDRNGELRCVRPNPHATTGSAASTAAVTTVTTVSNGATATNVDAGLVGTYTNADCQVTVDNTGKIRFVRGTNDVTALLGGDEGDSVVVLGGGSSTSLTAYDIDADGRELEVSFSRGPGATAATPNYNAFASYRVPRPVVDLGSCTGLTKR